MSILSSKGRGSYRGRTNNIKKSISHCTGNKAKLAIVKTFLTGGIQPVVTVVISMLVWFGQNRECHLDNDQGRNNLINARHVG